MVGTIRNLFYAITPCVHSKKVLATLIAHRHAANIWKPSGHIRKKGGLCHGTHNTKYGVNEKVNPYG